MVTRKVLDNSTLYCNPQSCSGDIFAKQRRAPSHTLRAKMHVMMRYLSNIKNISEAGSHHAIDGGLL